MAYIPLFNIFFTPPPSGVVIVGVAYKLKTDPDVIGSYTTVTTSLGVNPDGSIVGGPFYINGLADNTEYTVMVFTQCGNYKQDIMSRPGTSGTTTSTTSTSTTSTTSTSTSSTTTTTTTALAQINYTYTETNLGAGIFGYAHGPASGEESGYTAFTNNTSGTFFLPEADDMKIRILPDFGNPYGGVSNYRIKVSNAGSGTVLYDSTATGSLETPQIATVAGSVYLIEAFADYVIPASTTTTSTTTLAPATTTTTSTTTLATTSTTSSTTTSTTTRNAVFINGCYNISGGQRVGSFFANKPVNTNITINYTINGTAVGGGAKTESGTAVILAGTTDIVQTASSNWLTMTSGTIDSIAPTVSGLYDYSFFGPMNMCSDT